MLLPLLLLPPWLHVGGGQGGEAGRAGSGWLRCEQGGRAASVLRTVLTPAAWPRCTPPPPAPQAMYNDGARVSWGGGIMGPKSQAAQKKRERLLAKDARV